MSLTNTPAPAMQEAALTAEQAIDAIMEQAQVFASAWAFLGGPFDNGSGLETAEREKANLRALLSKLRAPVAGEACAWFTEDHLTDKSATTWDRAVAERWREKGWPVRPLVYGDAAPQASEAVRDAKAEGFKAGLDKALEVLEHDDFATRMQSAQVIRALKSQSAALSAQPGAQKEKGDEA